jgi:predicted acyl esterase
VTCRPLLALLAGALLTVSVPAHADTVRTPKGTHRYTTSDAKVAVLDGPTGTHQATIDTRLYVPDNATAKTPQPAILMTHGFGLDKLSAEVTSEADFLARHGYVVLTYTAQGFGESTGCVTLQSRTYDVKDAQQLITKVLQTKPYVKKDAKGPLVGMVGGSYGGGITLNLAESDARIRAIAPGRTWNTLQYSLVPNNYVAPGDPTGLSHTLNKQGVAKLEWTSIFFASGNGNPLGGVPPTGTPAGDCPQDKLRGGDVGGEACPGFQVDVCETYTKIAASGDSDATDRALLADASGATAIGRLRVPTLLVQGQSDTLFNENDAASTYLSLKRQGVPVQMIWNAGGHGGYNSKPGECEVYGGGTKGTDACYLTQRTLAFFDAHLRGIPDSSPGFTYYRDWVAYQGSGPTHQYGDAPSFPLPVSRVFHLSGSNGLTERTPVTGSATVVNPPGGLPSAYTETSEFTGPDGTPSLANVPPTEVPGQHADFTTPAFATPLTVVGIPTLTVALSHVAPTDLTLFGKLYDVAPDGTATLIHRLIAPARIPSTALAQPVTIRLLGIAHRFAAGHRLRLTLATTDLTSYNNKVPDVITVRTGPQSSLTVQTDQARATVPPVISVGPVATPPVASGPRLPTTGLPGAVPGLAAVLLAVGLLLRRFRHQTH